VSWDALTRRVLELLAHGHSLYGGGQLDAGPLTASAELQRRAEQLVQVTASDGVESASPRIVRLADVLESTVGADSQLDTVLADARTNHSLGQRATRMILDDAHGDTAPATDTPLGRREALRRMAARLRAQRHYIHRSHRRSRVLAQRMKQLGYVQRRHVPGHVSAARVLPLAAVRYEKSDSRGHVRQRIATALDRMGITDPAARRNWIRGYETLIARESGGCPTAVASEPATAPGPTQQDGHGLGYARGITQTIPATFAHFHQPGTSTNIYDPVANICASMNYVIHRYGVSADGSDLVALVQQADARRPPKGY
jgi:SLT domain-containing protein